TGWEPKHAAAFAVNLVAFALIGPIAEELTFRGLGFYLLEGFVGQTATILVLGIMFGLWHGLIEALSVLCVFSLFLASPPPPQSTFPGIYVARVFQARGARHCVDTLHNYTLKTMRAAIAVAIVL